MRNRSVPCLVAAVGWVSACSAAHAQDCLWASVPNTGAPSPTYLRGDFVGAQSRVLLAGLAFPSPMQLWAKDQTGWTLLASGFVSQRTGQSVAYDSARGRLVMFGGRGPSPTFQTFRETWEWDGIAWGLVSAAGPSFRSGQGMVYDAGRGRCVMFGGRGQGALGLQTGTWEWDGAQWTLMTLTGPPLRDTPAMAYDSDRARTVLFGGLTETGQLLGDTWEWDGASWVQRAGAGPSPRYDARMVYDPVRHRAVLFGGVAVSATLNDTWEYDGAAGMWVLRTGGGPLISFTPPPAFVFDTGRGIGLFFQSAAALWEWRGSAAGEGPWITVQPQSQLVAFGGPATMTATATGTAPLTYQWYRGATPVVNSGNVSGADSPTLMINSVGLGEYGQYHLDVTNSCGTRSSAVGAIIVLSQCYANCDHSFTPPFLNVLDFGCFVNTSAAGCTSPTDCYVNCDGSTTLPYLNVLDFACFLNAFAAGCSAP